MTGDRIPSMDSPGEAHEDDPSEVLHELTGGREFAGEELVQVVYSELRNLAQTFLARERSDHTLQPTALVHEAYMRLGAGDDDRWNDRTHFFATAARAMRQVLVDHARGKGRKKRGGGWKKVELDPEVAGDGAAELDLERLDRALDDLAKLDERKAKVVEMRYFAGLPVEAVAAVLGVTERTVVSDWRFARAFLARALEEED